MGKIISGNQGPVLGIETSSDMYEKLKFESDRLANGWGPYDAFNFLVTAWHLFQDWTKSDAPGSLNRAKRRRANLSESMNFVLDITRDLVNGSKHFLLDPNAVSKRKVKETHDGVDANWHSFFFHENMLGVTAQGTWYFSVRVLRNILLSYFSWVFDDSISVKEFPHELNEALNYCNIGNRKNMSPPALWAL